MTPILEKYREFLPLGGVAQTVDLGEGNTPLIRGISISPNGGALYLKLEQLNPTGSFKDRFAAVEAALLKQAGLEALIATSSGNTGSALAAYSARYRLRCLLFVNEVTPTNKLKQMLVYGARVFRIKGFGVSKDQSGLIFSRLQQVAEATRAPLVVSAFKYSPAGMEGIKTIAYEIVEQLGKPPDQVFVPVGGGGLLTGIWRGFLDLKDRALIDRLPRMNAVQPILNDTMVSALVDGGDKAREVTTTTNISGLAVQVDIDATLALRAVKASDGYGYLVSDEDIRRAQQDLCLREGIFVEPAGAASVAGFLQASAQGLVGSDENVVCILTGHGLKDTSSAEDASLAKEIVSLDLSEIDQRLIERS